MHKYTRKDLLEASSIVDLELSKIRELLGDGDFIVPMVVAAKVLGIRH